MEYRSQSCFRVQIPLFGGLIRTRRGECQDKFPLVDPFPALRALPIFFREVINSSQIQITARRLTDGTGKLVLVNRINGLQKYHWREPRHGIEPILPAITD